MRIWLLLVAVWSTAWGGESAGISEIRFSNDDIPLSGTVFTPRGTGPFPGMVLVHGSGPGERSSLLPQAQALSALGLVVLSWDKRGSGKSGGSWINSSLEDLAGDAAAALSALQALPQVDRCRTGYWGISQGGWIVPVAAARSKAAFAIIVSGGGMRPRDVELAAYRAKVRAADPSEQASDDSERMFAAYFDYLAGTVSRADLASVFDEFRDRDWFNATGIDRVVPSEVNRHNWAWVAQFEPRQTIAAMQVPVLVLLGDKDPMTPVVQTSDAWKAALPQSVPGSQVRVFTGAGHGIRTGAHGGDFAEGFFEAQADWLHAINILVER